MDRENRVREIAYLIWEEEGRPDGEAERHWLAAEIVCDSEDLERKNEDAERKDVEGEPTGKSAKAPDAAEAKPIGDASKRKSAA